ncbi:50S ribosomal protein L10 [Listeria monocytogenes]|nr:50S ribosomal protein L10 [Listeria monocytogenes]
MQSIDSNPSRDGSVASALISSREATLPSITPALISSAS